jgi:aminoglycoside phosphotransferase (APT) family kinase protein
MTFTVDLEIEQVRNIVCALNRPFDLETFNRLHGGTNEVYRIDLAGHTDPLVLKIYRDEPEWIVRKEALVAGWIGERLGLPIPRWLLVDERRMLIPFRFALMTWLPGTPVRHLMNMPDIDVAYRQMGALLRRVHTISMDAYGYVLGEGIAKPQRTNVDYMRFAFDSAFREFRDLGGDAELVRRLEQKAKADFEVFAWSAGPVLCHDDFQQGNVLASQVDGEGLLLTGLIDFGNARSGDALMDLAKALFCCGHEDPRSREPLLVGYGELDHPDPKRAIWDYTLLHRLTMWSHLTRHDRASGAPADLLRDLREMSR